MADGKENPIRFYGKNEGFEYQGEARMVSRDAEIIILIELWCLNKPKGDLVPVLAVSLSNPFVATADIVSYPPNLPQLKFLEQALEKLASNKILVDNEMSKIQMSVCPTMARDMEKKSPDFRREIYADPKLLEKIKSVVVNRNEQSGINMNDGTAHARAKTYTTTDKSEKKRRETEVEKLLRLNKKNLRCERELRLLNSLTPEELKMIDEVLKLLAETKSTWLVSMFKLATSARSRELSMKYGEAEMSFELGINTWSEIWSHPELKIKMYDSVSDCLNRIPDILQDRFSNFARRIKKIRIMKMKQD